MESFFNLVIDFIVKVLFIPTIIGVEITSLVPILDFRFPVRELAENELVVYIQTGGGC